MDFTFRLLEAIAAGIITGLAVLGIIATFVFAPSSFRRFQNWLNTRRMKREREKKFPLGGVSSPQKQGGEYVVPMRVTATITTITCTGSFPPRGIFSFDDPETSLELRLRIAIENEDYEEAARLRDEIKKREDAND